MREIDVKDKKVYDVITSYFCGDGEQVVVPAFQRKYNWGGEQWRDFFDSIKDFVDENGQEISAGRCRAQYFFGNVIIQQSKKDQGVYKLIDGQQRIVTFLIFFKVLSSYLEKVKREQGIVIVGSEKMNEINSKSIRFINKKENRNFSDFFKYKGEKENNSFLKCAKFFRCELEKVKWKKIINYFRTVHEHLVFALLTIPASYGIEKLFMAINSQGMNLNEADLIRAFTYSEVVEEKNKRELKKGWENFDDLFLDYSPLKRNNKIIGFFSDFYNANIMKEENFISKQRLFGKFKEYLKEIKENEGERKIVKFVENLSEWASLYLALADPQNERWAYSWPDMFILLKKVNLLGIAQLNPLLLKWVYFNKKEHGLKITKRFKSMVRVLEKIIIFSFRRTTIMHKYPSENVKRVVVNILQPLNKKKISFNDDKVEEMIEFILRREMKDQEEDTFSKELEERLLKGKTTKIVSFTLRSFYEKLLEDLSSRPHIWACEIEHIVARKAESVDKESVEKLGNKTLLRALENKEKSSDLTDKKFSDYPFVRYEKDRESYPDEIIKWDKSVIDHRTKNLIRQIIKENIFTLK